jgi:dynein heavy chain 1, cytosolic
LNGESIAEGGQSARSSQRLFVWSAAGGDDGTVFEASCFQLPKNTRYSGALVFCRSENIASATATSTTEGGATEGLRIRNTITNASQIQCITLQPVSDFNASDVYEDSSMAIQQQTPTAMLSTLQLITRQCILPTVQSLLQDDVTILDSLSSKIRELTVALEASSRSTRLPHVSLGTDVRIQAAAGKLKGDTKIDWQVLGLSDCLEDDTYLNSLQTGVSQWIVQIRKVTVLPKTTPFVDGNAVEELAFWTQLQSELHSIQQQLQEPTVTLQLALLRETKRFVATLALENNTGIEQAVAITSDVVNFLQGYPLQQLQAAVDSFDKIVVAVRAIFDHFPKIRQSRYYSLERCVQLFEATTYVLKESLLSVLTDKYHALLFMDYKEYEEKVFFPCTDIIAQFKDRFEEWKDFIMEQARRRKVSGMNRALEKITLHHSVVADRLEQIHGFRSSQEKLRQVVHTVLREEEPEALQQVESAPRQIFSAINIFDLSSIGNQALENALEEYDLQMDATQERLARLLRDKLTACRDAEDMFGVFARFNMLLGSTRVNTAVKEFQMQLINTVTEAVSRLQSKFTLKYESSAAARISRLRGIPPVAGKILWAKQMERQVNALMERMGHVLGPNWGQQLEGRQLRKAGDELLAKLDAKSFFRGWVQEWEKELASVTTTRLQSFPIVVEPDLRGGVIVAKVNFDEKSELLFQEIRHLKWLGYGKDIPKTLVIVSDEAVARFPFAVTIKTALRSYQAVRVLITPELEPLVRFSGVMLQ